MTENADEASISGPSDTSRGIQRQYTLANRHTKNKENMKLDLGHTLILE